MREGGAGAPGDQPPAGDVAGGPAGRLGAPDRGSKLPPWTREQYAQISKLLDEALELASESRGAWLAALERRDPDLAAELRALLEPAESRVDSIITGASDLADQLAALPEVDKSLVGRHFGPYRVCSLLGHGGMGSVWLAERADGLFARRVALKLVHPALMSMGLAERLSRERAILASLDHPLIARLFDAGISEDGQPYLALEYVAGLPLGTYCDGHRLPVRARLELFQQVLGAVRYAHAHLVIHRDLKPSNILVTETGRLYLLDFGIAKLLSESTAKETELTLLSGRVLSLEYASPEQIAGAPLTTAADIYALGVMLYELLTGERPYRLPRCSRAALEEAILSSEPALPSRAVTQESAAKARGTTVGRLARVLQGDLDTIVMQALRKSPVERYATVDAFMEDVARWLRGEAILARRDNPVYRAVKFMRRHWVAAAVTTGFLLTLVGGLAATSYESRVAAGQRDAALEAQLRSLTQTAAARLKDGDPQGALAIILEVLPHRGVKRAYTSDALNLFQEARAADAQIFAFLAGSSDVTDVHVSPDGRRIVTASGGNTPRIWDTATGRELRTLLLGGHSSSFWGASLSADGLRIVAWSADGTARIWSVATGREELEFRGHTDKVWGAAFSPDGRRVVTASWDKTARIWNAGTGQEVLRLKHDDKVGGTAFSPDGRRVITGSHDTMARVWDAATGQELLRLKGHREAVWHVGFSPDGRRIITGSSDGTARLWDADNGRLIVPLLGHTNEIWDARFSPDGQRVVTSSSDGTARIWDATYGRQIAVLVHPEQVNAATFFPDGRYLITVSPSGTARIWDTATDRQSITRIEDAHQLSSAAFSPDGRRILAASYDKTATIWDAQTALRLATLRGHADRVWSAAFAPDGRRVATSSRDRSVRVWDAATGQELLRLTGHTEPVYSAMFSSDARRIVTSSYDRTARIWDAATGQELLQLGRSADFIDDAVFSPDARRVLTASADRTAAIWDAITGQVLLRLAGHTDTVNSAHFSSDARRVLTASEDKTARIWDAATGRELQRLTGHSDAVRDAEFSPDGERVVTASNDQTVRVWDAVTGRQMMLYKGHDNEVQTAQFSPDGRRIVSASWDGTARVWDARVPPLEQQLDWAEAAQFDTISGTARFALGLPAETSVREWPTPASMCDQLATAPYDPDRRAPGAVLEKTTADNAVAACGGNLHDPAESARTQYQHGRALAAAGNLTAARRDFEEALARGYRAARIDLARLLADPAGGVSALRRAISLYEQAWSDGVSIAGFELGQLYEHGVARSDRSEEYLVPPDQTRAWSWYRKAAQSHEPNALARFGEQADEAAFAASTEAQRNARFLDAFKYFASAAERARHEAWPDEAWRRWRYRRASLARSLARAGMMQEVAEVYVSVWMVDAPPPPTLWQRLGASVRAP
jgi:WD40 repeat protein/serine/threonine protein kinase/TPR repeat protein